MSSSAEVARAIRAVDSVIGLEPAPEGESDERWQRILALCNHLEDHDETIWEAIVRWLPDADDDLRAALGTCLIEELLAIHFDRYFERLERWVRTDQRAALVVLEAWPSGAAAEQPNLRSFRALQREALRLLGKPHFSRVGRRPRDQVHLVLKVTPLPPTWARPL